MNTLVICSSFSYFKADYATVTVNACTGAITFANTMSLGMDTTSIRLVLYPGTGTADWYELGIHSSTMIYSVPGLAAHDFYSAGMQVPSIEQAYTTLKHSLSLVSCITINHPGSSTLSTSSAHIRYTYLTAEPLNFNLTGTTIKPCATITLPAVGVWMVV